MIVAHPSEVRLPRTVRGPKYTHSATISWIDERRVETTYGPITVTVGPPDPEADPLMLPEGVTGDPDPPSLPALLFWGEGAEPKTYSMFNTGPTKDKSWLSFVVVTQGWQIEVSSMYAPADREVVIRTAEAVWATLASINANAPR